MLGALVIGAISGLLGGFFIFINFKINGYRNLSTNKNNWSKLLEACVFAFLTATCFYWFPLRFESCLENCVGCLPDGGSMTEKTSSLFDKADNYDVS